MARLLELQVLHTCLNLKESAIQTTDPRIDLYKIYSILGQHARKQQYFWFLSSLLLCYGCFEICQCLLTLKPCILNDPLSSVNSSTWYHGSQIVRRTYQHRHPMRSFLTIARKWTLHAARM